MTGPGSHDGRRHAIVALDTATRTVVVAIGLPDGEAIGISSWEAGFRHGETLLPSLSRFLGETNVRRSRIDGLIVGTGPGAFTGLRVGVATAKGLAHALGKPIVGVPTGEALLEAIAHETGESREAFALLLPAGPADRVLVRSGERPVLLPGGEEPALRDERLVALDLDGRAPRGRAGPREAGAGRSRPGSPAARRRPARGGRRRRPGAARAGIRDAAARRASGETGEVAWSRGPR